LEAGDIVTAGRWGATVLSRGQTHPFYYRELLLELWRVSNTQVSVSRLTGIFGFEDERVAEGWSDVEHLYRVEPLDWEAPRTRLDML
jgi:hypothetical protein